MKDVLPDDAQIRIRPVEVRESEEPLVPERLLREIPLLGERNPMVPASAYLGDIDLWESCPFRYYAERVLGLKERRPGVFDPARAGNAIHALWNSAWTERKRTGDTLIKLVPELWQKKVMEIYPGLFGEKSPLKRHRKRLYDQTLRLAKVQDDIDGAGLEKNRKDQKLEGKLQTTIEGVTFTGRFDRLDILDSGAVLLDYKSGSSSTYVKSLQLPAYALALRGKEFSPLLGWGYLCLADGAVSGRFTEPASRFFGKNKTSPETLVSQIEEAEKKLEAMAKGLLSGNFTPNWDSDACKTCAYRGLCRKDERPGGTRDEKDQ
jgi:RecB family exonuclease